MQFRFRTLIAAIWMLLFVYACAGAMLVRMIAVKFVGTPLTAGPVPQPPPINPCWWAVLSLGPALLAIEFVFKLVRRANKTRRGFCGGCGHRLPNGETRCAECGTRVNQYEKAESRFPVVLRSHSKT